MEYVLILLLNRTAGYHEYDAPYIGTASFSSEKYCKQAGKLVKDKYVNVNMKVQVICTEK